MGISTIRPCPGFHWPDDPTQSFMGLTIHYNLKSNAATTAEARSIVEKLHERANSLPFPEVSEIIELAGQNACDCGPLDEYGMHHFLLTQATVPIRYQKDGQDFSEAVAPKNLIAFFIDPGDGCEQANFGLCRYPLILNISGHSIETGLDGWRWHSFCKTQYASNPKYGGGENFLKCHLGIIHLLDYAKELGVLESVNDEGGFWENRNVETLLKQVGAWNTKMAHGYGALRDFFESMNKDTRVLINEIAKYPNFEHLEAEGRRN